MSKRLRHVSFNEEVADKMCWKEKKLFDCICFLVNQKYYLLETKTKAGSTTLSNSRRSLLVWEQPRALWGRTRLSFGIEPRLIRSLFQRGVALLRIVILKSLFLHLKSEVRLWTEFHCFKLYVETFLRVTYEASFINACNCINSNQ